MTEPLAPPRLVRSRRLVRGVSIALAVVTLAGLTMAYRFQHHPTLLAPGPIGRGHVQVEAMCVACHEGRAGIDVTRCARCHDAGAGRRLLPAAHDVHHEGRAAVSHAPDPDCATCHRDHRGRLAMLSEASDALCVNCHQFRAFAGHPAIRARAFPEAGEGIHFTHARHMRFVAPGGCESCHHPTADSQAFVPIAFDRDCASCHLAGGVLPGASDPVVRAALLPLAADAPPVQLRPFDQSRVTVAGLRHRDSWVVANLLRWRAASDPAGLQAEAVALATTVEREAIDSADRPRLDAADLIAERQRLIATSLALDVAAPPRDPVDVMLRLQSKRRMQDLLSRLRYDGERDARTRAEALAARLAVEPVTAARSTADRRARLTDAFRQLEIEIGMRAAGVPAPASSALRGGAEADTTARQAALGMLLQAWQDRDATLAPVAVDAAASLTRTCAVCHLFEGARQLPVTSPQPRLAGTSFRHAPHVRQTACATCHDAVVRSDVSTTNPLPALATCQTCHTAGKAPTACVACHAYHPVAAGS